MISKRTFWMHWELDRFMIATARWRILFVCTGNSCRSQMAEGWARALLGHVVDAHSAGVDPHGLDPLAVDAMTEAGVDISSSRSKRIDEEKLEDFDCIVALSEKAHAAIVASGYSGTILFAEFPASPKSAGAHAEAYYHRLRDEIRVLVLSLRRSDGVRVSDSATRRRWYPAAASARGSRSRDRRAVPSGTR